MKSVLASLISLSLFSIALRYPADFHAKGIDTFYIAGHTESVLVHGHLGWVIHPLSYVGLFPGSIPSGGPAIFASLAGIAGIPGEASIVLTDLCLTILAVLSTFLLAHRITRRNSIALLAAGIFAMSPRFVAFTDGSGSTRAFLLALVPVVLLMLMRSFRVKTRSTKEYFLLVSVVVLPMVFHRAAIFLAMFLLAFFVAIYLRSWVTGSATRRVAFAAAYLVTFLGMILAQLLRLLPKPVLLESGYSSGVLFTGTDVKTMVANMVVDYGTSVGIASLFLPVGLAALLGSRLRFEATFLLASLWSVAWILGQGQYAILLVLPGFCFFSASGFFSLISRLRIHRSAYAVGCVILVIGTAFSAEWMVSRWAASAGESLYVNSELSDTATFLHAQAPSGFFISNDWSSSSYKIWSITGNPPVTWSLSPALIEGVIQADELEVSFLPTAKGLYYTPTFERADWVQIMTRDPLSPQAQHAIARYDLHYFIEVHPFPNPLTTAVFVGSVHENQYRLYTNERYSVWMLPVIWN